MVIESAVQGASTIHLIDWFYQSFTAHQNQKGHTVPKEVSPLDDDDDITESTRWMDESGL